MCECFRGRIKSSCWKLHLSRHGVTVMYTVAVSCNLTPLTIKHFFYNWCLSKRKDFCTSYQIQNVQLKTEPAHRTCCSLQSGRRGCCMATEPRLLCSVQSCLVCTSCSLECGLWSSGDIFSLHLQGTPWRWMYHVSLHYYAVNMPEPEDEDLKFLPTWKFQTSLCLSEFCSTVSG